MFKRKSARLKTILNNKENATTPTSPDIQKDPHFDINTLRTNSNLSGLICMFNFVFKFFPFLHAFGTICKCQLCTCIDLNIFDFSFCSGHSQRGNVRKNIPVNTDKRFGSSNLNSSQQKTNSHPLMKKGPDDSSPTRLGRFSYTLILIFRISCITLYIWEKFHEYKLLLLWLPLFNMLWCDFII